MLGGGLVARRRRSSAADGCAGPRRQRGRQRGRRARWRARIDARGGTAADRRRAEERGRGPDAGGSEPEQRVRAAAVVGGRRRRAALALLALALWWAQKPPKRSTDSEPSRARRSCAGGACGGAFTRTAGPGSQLATSAARRAAARGVSHLKREDVQRRRSCRPSPPPPRRRARRGRARRWWARVADVAVPSLLDGRPPPLPWVEQPGTSVPPGGTPSPRPPTSATILGDDGAALARRSDSIMDVERPEAPSVAKRGRGGPPSTSAESDDDGSAAAPSSAAGSSNSAAPPTPDRTPAVPERAAARARAPRRIRVPTRRRPAMPPRARARCRRRAGAVDQPCTVHHQVGQPTEKNRPPPLSDARRSYRTRCCAARWARRPSATVKSVGGLRGAAPKDAEDPVVHRPIGPRLVYERRARTRWRNKTLGRRRRAQLTLDLGTVDLLEQRPEVRAALAYGQAAQLSASPRTRGELGVVHRLEDVRSGHAPRAGAARRGSACTSSADPPSAAGGGLAYGTKEGRRTNPRRSRVQIGRPLASDCRTLEQRT